MHTFVPSHCGAVRTRLESEVAMLHHEVGHLLKEVSNTVQNGPCQVLPHKFQTLGTREEELAFWKKIAMQTTKKDN